MRVGILRFPGSNCDGDCLWAFGSALGVSAEYIWHKEERFRGNFDLLVIPGGFSYGDYLRSGAIARFSPAMKAVEAHARSGGLTLGICNGFQILTEAGLLPGVLARNRGLKFLSREVRVRIENVVEPWTARLRSGQVLRMPIAHHDGAFTADPETLAEIEAGGQVLLRYVAPDGSDDPAWNFNGATSAIAGVRNREGNVFGLMPHPERAMEDVLGSADGRLLLQCLIGGKEVAA